MTRQDVIGAGLATEGHAYCLVNNADIMLLGPLEASRTGDWQRTIDLDQRRSVAGRVARGGYSVWPPATSQPLSASSSSASKRSHQRDRDTPRTASPVTSEGKDI
jgi:hypothetical protein